MLVNWWAYTWGLIIGGLIHEVYGIHFKVPMKYEMKVKF